MERASQATAESEPFKRYSILGKDQNQNNTITFVSRLETMRSPSYRIGSANQESQGSDETKKHTNASESDMEDDDMSEESDDADEEEERKSAYSDSPNQR